MTEPRWLTFPAGRNSLASLLQNFAGFAQGRWLRPSSRSVGFMLSCICSVSWRYLCVSISCSRRSSFKSSSSWRMCWSLAISTASEAVDLFASLELEGRRSLRFFSKSIGGDQRSQRKRLMGLVRAWPASCRSRGPSLMNSRKRADRRGSIGRCHRATSPSKACRGTRFRARAASCRRFRPPCRPARPGRSSPTPSAGPCRPGHRWHCRPLCGHARSAGLRRQVGFHSWQSGSGLGNE